MSRKGQFVPVYPGKFDDLSAEQKESLAKSAFNKVLFARGRKDKEREARKIEKAKIESEKAERRKKRKADRCELEEC